MSHIELIEQHALEREPQPTGFKFFRWCCRPERGPTLYYEVTGAVALFTYSSGKRKGHVNWKRRDKATDKTFIVTVADQEAYESQWQERTGKCLNCLGKGRTWTGWSAENGHTYRTCQKCNGVGAEEEKPAPLQRELAL